MRAQESVEAAMHNVMQAIHRIGTGVLQIQLHIPTDWFHQRRKELAPMENPAGSSTTPVGSVINLLNGTLGTCVCVCVRVCVCVCVCVCV